MFKQYPLIDLHQDLMCHIKRRDLFPPGQWQTNFEMIRNSGLKLVVATAFPVPSDENFFDPVANEIIEQEFDSYAQQCAKPGWSLVRTADDVDSVMTSQQTIGLLLHIEGLNVVDAQSFDRLERWYNKGWRSLGIVWNLTNPLGGGTLDVTQGLTPLGADILDWCQAKRMIIDFGHMNEPTFWDAAKIVDRPIYISHGNCRSLCDNPRNYSDKQLRVVAKSGGVIGVFFAKTFVTGKDRPGNILHLVAHIRHLLRVIGDDHIAFGTDFGGIMSGFLDGLDSLDRFPDVLFALEQGGVSDSVIEKICWKNAARVLKQHLGT